MDILEKKLLGFAFKKSRRLTRREFNQRMGLRGYTKKESRAFLFNLIRRNRVNVKLDWVELRI